MPIDVLTSTDRRAATSYRRDARRLQATRGTASSAVVALFLPTHHSTYSGDMGFVAAPTTAPTHYWCVTLTRVPSITHLAPNTFCTTFHALTPPVDAARSASRIHGWHPDTCLSTRSTV